jgi:hypothetical protein
VVSVFAPIEVQGGSKLGSKFAQKLQLSRIGIPPRCDIAQRLGFLIREAWLLKRLKDNQNWVQSRVAKRAYLMGILVAIWDLACCLTWGCWWRSDSDGESFGALKSDRSVCDNCLRIFTEFGLKCLKQLLARTRLAPWTYPFEFVSTRSEGSWPNRCLWGRSQRQAWVSEALVSLDLAGRYVAGHKDRSHLRWMLGLLTY